MVALDSLVVTTALSTIRRDLDVSMETLEWTVDAYNLSFAVLLLTGAALGEHYGRRRLFVFGLFSVCDCLGGLRACARRQRVAYRTGPTSFGAFAAFATEADRNALLTTGGPKMSGEFSELFVEPPSFEKADVLLARNLNAPIHDRS
jgi:MFS family permease